MALITAQANETTKKRQANSRIVNAIAKHLNQICSRVLIANAPKQLQMRKLHRACSWTCNFHFMTCNVSVYNSDFLRYDCATIKIPTALFKSNELLELPTIEHWEWETRFSSCLNVFFERITLKAYYTFSIEIRSLILIARSRLKMNEIRVKCWD